MKLMRRRNNKDLKWYIIPILLILVIIGCGAYAIREITSYNTAISEYDNLDKLIVNDKDKDKPKEEEDDTPKFVVKDYPELDIDFEELESINPDFIGVIYIPVLELRYPIVHSKDNLEYLDKTFEGNTNAAGAIFLDYECSRIMNDKNVFIYGHNMKNQTMFGSLKRFMREEGLCAEDPYIYVYTKNDVRKYQIFAYYIQNIDQNIIRPLRNNNEYDEYMEMIKEANLYEKADAVSLYNRPNILTLYTCHGTSKTEKFLVNAALESRTLLD